MINRSIIIRKATEDELTIAKSLDRLLFSKDICRDFSNDIVWIGWDGDKPIAYCSLRFLDDKIVFLSRAGVLEKYRGNGLQKRMIRLRVKAARAAKYKSVVTYTVIDNNPSSNNLIKCGFRLYTPTYKWAGKDVLYWMKSL